MKRKTLIRAFAALALVAGLMPIQALLPFETSIADAATASTSTNYYKSNLKTSEYPTARTFYDTLESMDFASGEPKEVTDGAVLRQAEAYTTGDIELIRNFGAAIDSFKFDHSEIFYVNWDNVSVNVYRTKAGSFKVEVGPGRTDNYYLDPAATKDSIREQISAYESALATIADSVTGSDAKSIAKSAAQTIGARCTYSFYDSVEYDGSLGQQQPPAGTASTYIHTAYGAAVNGFCVCEGYSRLFKQVLDIKGVQTELVQGNFIDGESFEPHMWNHVKDGSGDWYGVDVTALDGHSPNERPINAPSQFDKYFWRTSETFGLNHMECAAISSVQYEMPYPALKDFWITPTWSGRFQCGTGYYDKDHPDAFWFSYNGKGAARLKNEDGLYMAMHTAITNAGIREVSDWQSIEQWSIPFKDYIDDKGDKVWFLGYNISSEYYEIGIFDTKDDIWTDERVKAAKKYSDSAIKSHLLETSYINNPYWDPTYRKAPYIQSITPSTLFQQRQDILGKLSCEIVYDTELKLVDTGKRDSGGNIALDLDYYVTSYNNSDLNEAVVKKFAKLENARLTNRDGKGVISFDFTPSKQYNHNLIWYNFVPKNAVSVLPEVTDENRSEASKYNYIYPDGVPVPQFTLVFAYSNQTACPNVYGDGRLWVNTYAQPMLVSTSDLSMDGWTYETTNSNGQVVEKSVSEGQRSQMALVVSTPQDEKAVSDAAKSQLDNPGAAVKASKTYEIDFNICGKNPVIPDGSYVNVNLGIPDSTFEDLMKHGSENVTFQLYHFKKINIVKDAAGKIVSYDLDYNDPEVIPCTLTQYGLIAKIKSFSPFVLMAIDKSQLSAAESAQFETRTITAQSNGNGAGGSLEVSGSETLSSAGDSVTYTFVPDDGYELEFVKLNGVPIDAPNNQVTLEYSALRDGNTLTYGFVSSAVKAAEADNDLELVLSPSNDGIGEGGGADGNEQHTHIWTEGTPDPAATCVSEGTMRHSCAVGSCTETKEETYSDPNAHSYGAESTVAPTCTEAGYNTKTCTLCGTEHKWQFVEATGHARGSLKTARIEPTCSTEGREAVYDCIKHDAELGGEVIPKKPHDFKEYLAVPPTCEETGTTAKQVCQVCGHTEGGATIVARGHAFGKPAWTWDDSYANASAKFTCENDALHSYDAIATVTTDDSDPEKGVIHLASVQSRDGRKYTDAVLFSKSGALVKGTSVKDGFVAQLADGIEGKTAQITSDYVDAGSVYDALASNVANKSLKGTIAGAFDVKLVYSDDPATEIHRDFGTLSLEFPVDASFNGRYAIIHHCHANDTSNITAHSDYVVKDGKIAIDGITDLSTFAVEIAPESYKPTVEQKKNPADALGSALAETGDTKAAGMLSALAIAGMALAVASAAGRRTRKNA